MNLENTSDHLSIAYLSSAAQIRIGRITQDFVNRFPEKNYSLGDVVFYRHSEAARETIITPPITAEEIRQTRFIRRRFTNNCLMGVPIEYIEPVL